MLAFRTSVHVHSQGCPEYDGLCGMFISPETGQFKGNKFFLLLLFFKSLNYLLFFFRDVDHFMLMQDYFHQQFFLIRFSLSRAYDHYYGCTSR